MMLITAKTHLRELASKGKLEKVLDWIEWVNDYRSKSNPTRLLNMF